MSLLRAAVRRPLATACAVHARTFASTCVRNEHGSNATSELINSLGAITPRQGRSSTNSTSSSQPAAASRPGSFPPRARDPAAPGVGGGGSSSSDGSRSELAQNLVRNEILANNRTAAAAAAVPNSDAVMDSGLQFELSQQMPRRWSVGDVYAPHDLSSVEARKWRRARRTPAVDTFEMLALDPLKEYKNFSIMSEYISEMGRIKHSRATGLRPRNQRKLAKAVRRAIGIGIMPSVHIHPELIKSTAGGRQASAGRGGKRF